MITGLRPESFENMQLNAGVFLKNFDYSSYTSASELLAGIDAALSSGTGVIGATIGGGSFQATPTIRQIEADGMRAPIKGSTINDMWVVKLTGTMKEITPSNFKDALVSADMTTSGDVTTIKLRNSIANGDYIPTLCWVGDTSDNGFVLINLTNALNLTGANFTFTDKGEGSLPFEFQAHQEDLSESQYAPVEIVFFDGAIPPDALAVTSAAGTSTGKSKITVSQTATGSNIYKYKAASVAQTLELNDDLSAWTTWDGTAEISGLTVGQKITVAICNSDNLCKAAGSATIVVAQ